MTTLRDISSTEKLLDLIRGKAEKKPTEEHPAPVKAQPKARLSGSGPKSAPHAFSLLRRSVTIGVDFGHEALKMVKMSGSVDNVWTLCDYRSVALPSSASPNTPAYCDFLREELRAFCRGEKKPRIWVVMTAARVDVRHIRIPMVPGSQVEKVVYWTVKKESPFEDKESIFDFEVLAECVEQGIPKLAVMAYIAPREEVEQIKQLFSRIGVPLAGISIAPFAVQNIFRSGWIANHEETVANLFIGNDFSRIDIISRDNLVMSRDIKAGTNSMVESLMETLNERTERETDPSRKPAPVSVDQARRVLIRLSTDAPPPEAAEAPFPMEEGEVFEIIQPALLRMIRQIERTLDYFTSTLGNERIDKIYIAGVLNFYRRAVAFIGDQLGVTGDVLDPLDPQGPTARLIGVELTATPSERISLAPALGLALSTPYRTPNFIFTYKDKEIEAALRSTSRMIFFGFILLVALCSVIYSYQLITIGQMRNTLSTLKQETGQFNPRVDRNMVTESSLTQRQPAPLAKAIITRYSGLAIIGELTAAASPGIHLTDMKIILSPPQTAESASPAAKAPPQGKPRNLSVEGDIIGQQNDLEGELARYVMKIGASPLFQEVRLLKSSFESVKKGVVLHFTISAKIA